jgi:mannose-1-phosphate guanylyltransferase/mannose-6-phosphate isomerase
VCFGIKATHPSDAYGYIEKGTETPLESCFKINKFIEKPDKKEAKKLLASGCFFWNSGLLLFKPSVFLKELETHAPILYQQTQKAYQSLQNNAPKHYQIPLKTFESIKDISVDYALLEKTKKHVLIPCNTPWSDIGAWDTLKNALPTDAQGNVTRGQVITQGVKDSYIHATKRLVTAIGVENHIIVETADAVLVANQKDAQAVKTMVTTLKKQQQPVATKNLKVYRPWGRFETLTIGPRFHVKHIYVNPGASLSLQKHLHRAEHWVIVSGTAEVQKGEDVFILSENQSNYIPIGEVHRLKNIGKIPLELIEVQTGSYLGEDDIIRLEDHYGRVAQQPPIKTKSTT